MREALTLALRPPDGRGLRAPGRVPHRRRRRQRGRAVRADPRAPRRPAPVHRRHRLGAEQPLHDQGRAVRARHVHLHRRRPRGAGEDGGAVRQARAAGADRPRDRLAGRRRGLAARASRSVRRRAADRQGRARRRWTERSRCTGASAAGPGERRLPLAGNGTAAGVRRAVGAREDRFAHRLRRSPARVPPMCARRSCASRSRIIW